MDQQEESLAVPPRAASPGKRLLYAALLLLLLAEAVPVVFGLGCVAVGLIFQSWAWAGDSFRWMLDCWPL